MKRLLPTILLLCLPFFAFSSKKSVNDLLQELDQVLLVSEKYMEQKEHQLNRLKIQLKQEPSAENQFEICNRIIEEYKCYMSDSALVYVIRNLNHAKIHQQPAWQIQTELQYSFVLSSSGLFVESKNILEKIQRSEVPDHLIIDYFKCMELLYGNMNVYQDRKLLEENYLPQIQKARDSIMFYLPENSKERLFYDFLVADSEKRLQDAKTYLEAYIQTLHPGTHEYAKKNYNLAQLYLKMGDTEMQVKHLILAVISDEKDAVKENRALSDLSVCLFERKDINRAFMYIQHALNDANFYGARFRFFEISKLLPIITASYQEQHAKQNTRLKATFFIISLLFLLLLVLTLYLLRQMRALAKVRQKQKESNENLAKMNRKLNRLNHELSNANLIKEEYVGYFLDLCSEYIRYLENYRKTIHTKIAAKQFDELSRITSSSSDKTTEIKELYTNFDKAFLNIYPDFVSSLNELLKKEARFDIKKGDLLNTELRVFTLIRLGITDSSKIAAFLRCSVQTVYNYRSKIKRNVLDNSIDIEEKIRKIGVFYIEK